MCMAFTNIPQIRRIGLTLSVLLIVCNHPALIFSPHNVCMEERSDACHYPVNVTFVIKCISARVCCPDPWLPGLRSVGS